MSKPHWKTVTLGEVAENSTAITKDPFGDGHTRYVIGKHIPTDSSRIVTWNEVGDGEFGSRIRTIFRAGDIICTTRGPKLRVAVPDFDGLSAHTNFILRTKDPSLLLQKYLEYVVTSDGFQNHLKLNFRGSTNLFVNWSDAAKYEFPLPPVDEQRRIADLLWAADDVIQNWETTKQKAIQLLETTLSTTFDLKSSPGDEQNWQIAPLSEVAFLQTGIAKGKQYGKEIETVEMPYLSVLNVQDGFLDLTGVKKIIIPKKDVERYLLKSGDIVIAEGGDSDKVGRGAIWRGEISPCLHQNHVFVIRTNKEKISPEFLSFQMRSKYGKAYFLKSAKKTSNLASINSTQVKQFPVMMCFLDFENEAVAHLTQLENAVNQIDEHLSVSVNLKRSLLAKFVG